MLNIRPISELRNKAADISKLVHDTQEPVIITKQGYADMVVMSPEQYEYLLGNKRIDAALERAETESVNDAPRRDFREVAAEKRKRINEGGEDSLSV